jgi:DNA-directed RNA polymerase specialized sigma24 family protein
MGPSTVLSAGGMTLDPETFDAHLRPHLPVMHRLASRLAPAAADDVLQEAVLRAWQRWDTYRPDRAAFGAGCWPSP